MSGPDLHVFTLNFLAQKLFFSLFRGQKFFFIFFYKKGIMQLFSADAIVFSKKFEIYLTPKKVKQRASKVAHNWPRPFYSTVQPRP